MLFGANSDTSFRHGAGRERNRDRSGGPVLLMNWKLVLLATAVLFSMATLPSCGGGYGPSTPTSFPQTITISLSSNSTTLALGNSVTSSSVTVTFQRDASDTNKVILTIASLPAGVTAQSSGTGNSVTITFIASNNATPGTYGVTITATEGGSAANAQLALTVLSAPTNVNVKINPTVNTSVGFNGRLQTFMTTSFQAAEWDQSFFSSIPNATANLVNLNSQHMRVLTTSQGVPQRQDKSWDFSVLDATLDPVIGVGDKSIVLVLQTAPPWMNDQNGHLLPEHFQDFAAYAAQMVKYFNTTAGFTDASGTQHVHAPFTPVTYWGIFNEPDINGLTAAQYTDLYNQTVSAMLAAGSQVPMKFVAVELSGVTDPNDYIPTFIQNVTGQVDVATAHYFAVCGWTNSDASVFDTIPQQATPAAQHFATLLANSSNLNHVQLWMSDNNIDVDIDLGNGIGQCVTPFKIDQRATDAFFTAWRPYLFSQWAQAGSHMLAHWNFNQDATYTKQFGEVTFTSGQPYLSYWMDYYLQRYFPYCAPDEPSSCTNTGSDILEFTSSEPAGSQTVEILASKNNDGSIVIMAVNHAVNSSSDVDGFGAPRNIVLDLSSLGAFSYATELTIDKNTDVTNGPTTQNVTPLSQMTISLSGYGVTFLKLNP